MTRAQTIIRVAALCDSLGAEIDSLRQSVRTLCDDADRHENPAPPDRDDTVLNLPIGRCRIPVAYTMTEDGACLSAVYIGNGDDAHWEPEVEWHFSERQIDEWLDACNANAVELLRDSRSDAAISNYEDAKS